MDLNTSSLTDGILTMTSIILGFYITAISTFYGKNYMFRLSKEIDPINKTKTKLYVLICYFKTSVFFSLTVIVFTILNSMLSEKLNNQHFSAVYSIIIKLLNPIIVGMVILNIIMMWLLFKNFIYGLKNEADESSKK